MAASAVTEATDVPLDSGPNTVLTGVIAIARALPALAFRRWYQDRGTLPAQMLADLTPDGGTLRERKAGILPYATLVAGVLVGIVSNQAFRL